VDDRVIILLRRRLSADAKNDLRNFVLHNPRDIADWMRKSIDQIVAGA